MNNCLNERKSDLQSVSTFSFTLIKNRFELNNFCHLPVIKEEDVSEENSNFSEEILQHPLVKKSHEKRKGNYKSYLKSSEKMFVTNDLKTFPTLVNVNCMMNTDVKQSKAIWETNFGKRLIGEEISDEEIKTNSVQNNCRKKEEPNIFLRRKPIQEKVKNGGRVKLNISKRKQCRGPNSVVNKTASETTDVQKNPIEVHLTESFPEILVKESKGDSSTVSTGSKNQKFLTECVRSILNREFNEIICEDCKESFSNVVELSNHKNQHVFEEKTCPICEKVFSNPNDFMKHLLTHESVDHFSCKKCKKYFPNLKKYKKHCKDFHTVLEGDFDYENQGDAKYVEKWLSRFECKRCQVAFESKEVQEAHRRNHNRKDLMGAYLLSPKNM